MPKAPPLYTEHTFFRRTDTLGDPLDTKLFEYFLETYESGSINRAAEKLFISPQGLSKAISRLETEVGTALFTRTSKGVEPTTAAFRLHAKAKSLIEAVHLIEAEVAGGLSRGSVSVASSCGYITCLGGAFISAFETKLPSLRLIVTETNDRGVTEQVESGAAAIGLVAGPVNYELFDASLISRHPHVLVVPREDPLAGQDTVSLHDLDGRRIAIMGAGYSPYCYLQDRLARDEIKPSGILGVSEFGTAELLVRRNEGVFITADFAAELYCSPETTWVPFNDPTLSWDVFLITLKDAPTNPDAAVFAGFLAEWAKSHYGHLFPRIGRR